MKLTPVAFALFVALPVTALAAAAQPQPIEATLSLPYETVLPGVPFDMTVTLKNVSKSTASVGISARLIVTLPNGTKVSSEKGHVLDPQVSGHPDTWVQLSPGESRQWIVDWH